MIQAMGKGKAKLTVNIGSGAKRKRRSKIVTYTGKRDLQRQYNEFEAEVKRQPYSDISVSELVSSYIKNRKTLGLKPTTLKGYEAAKKRIDECIGDMSAAKVTGYIVEDFVMEMAERLSPKTIRNTISLLSSAYDRAIRTGHLAENPCQRVELPKREKPEIVVFSEQEVVKFWNALDKERLDYKVGYGLCMLCGLRRSEVLGLTEDSINVPFRCLTVRTTRHRIDGSEDIIQDTKTTTSERTLAIPDILMDDIMGLIEERHAFRFEHTDYLIQDGFGQPLSPDTFSKHIHVVERDNDLPHVTVHGLRHTFATMLNAAGVDIARISAELGHSNIGTTLNVYTHVFGNVSTSSRGIADTVSDKIKSASFLPLEEKKKA